MSDPGGERTNGSSAPPPAGPPVPFLLSCAAGTVGLVLIVAGIALGNKGLAVAGFVAGSLSLGAALYWRSLLISAWAQKQGRPPR